MTQKKKKTKQTNKLPSFVDRSQILSHKTATYQQVLFLSEVLFNFGLLDKIGKNPTLLTRNDQRKRRRAMVSSTTMRFVEESLLRRIKKTQEIQRKDNKEIEKSRELASSRGRKTWVRRRRRRRSVKCNPFALDCLGICVLFMLRAPYTVCAFKW